MADPLKIGQAEWHLRAFSNDLDLATRFNHLAERLHVHNDESARAEYIELLPEILKGELVYEEHHINMVVRLARADVLKHIFNVGSPINTGFIYLGAGSGSTAAAVTNTALGTELTGNASRLTVTNTSGGALSGSDIVQETSGSFDQKIVVQGTYGTGDGNNGSNFREYGLFSSATFGAGTMFNRFVAASNIAKTSAFSLVAQVTIRS